MGHSTPSVLSGPTTYWVMPLSRTSYILIALFHSFHTVGVYYTYAQTPAGACLDGALHLGRNHYDRLVHFCIGFFLTYPVEELFRRASYARGWLLYYLPVFH
ncbi:MAG: DUF2238 domain-containing protein [Nitrospiraceae bacterium]